MKQTFLKNVKAFQGKCEDVLKKCLHVYLFESPIFSAKSKAINKIMFIFAYSIEKQYHS